MVKKDIAGAVIILTILLLVPFRTNGSAKQNSSKGNDTKRHGMLYSWDALFINGPRHYLNSEYSAFSQYAALCTDHFVDWGFVYYKSQRLIDVIVIHSTFNAGEGDEFSVAGVLNQFKNDGVTSHYLIDREGKIYKLVPDSEIAFHAGESMLPDGRANVNYCSIGIELINSPDVPPDSCQYESLNLLLFQLEMKYPIKIITGHSDIAPERKDDPWLFNWGKIKRLY